jgi:hypothetical protein
MMKLIHIPAHFVDQAWEEGASVLAKACDASGGEITGDQLKMLISRGERMLIKGIDGDKTMIWGAITIEQKPNMRVLHIGDVAGERPDWFFDELKKYAKSIGCSRIRTCGKPAQARLFKRFGFESVYETLEVIL